MKILEGVLDRGDTVASENAIEIQNIWSICYDLCSVRRLVADSILSEDRIQVLTARIEV